MDLFAEHVLVVTGCDTYLGRSLAEHLLREEAGRGRRRVRVLCRRGGEGCRRLKELGAEVVDIDYEDGSASLRCAFRGCEFVILVPEMTKDRVKHGEQAIEAMEREYVPHVLIMSMVGSTAEDGSLEYLREFRKLERHLELRFTRGRWCIFRIDFIQQLFFLWIPMIEAHRRLKLNIGRQGRFAPININDVCLATHAAVTGQWRNTSNAEDGSGWVPLNELHHKKAYRLTGPDSVDGEDIARLLNDVLGKEHEVRFENVSRERMKEEFERLREGAMGMEGGDGVGDAGQNRDQLRSETPMVKYLTATKIQTLLDFFEFVKTGDADFVSGDIRKLTGEEPERLDEFFRRHREDFNSIARISEASECEARGEESQAKE